MAEIHPPDNEMPSKLPPIHESLGPTSNKSLVTVAKFSPLDNSLAIGYEDGLVEIYELVDKDWVCFYTFSRTDAPLQDTAVVQESPVGSILWHPILAQDMLVGFQDGSAHAISFLDQSGGNFGKARSFKVLDFSPAYVVDIIDWSFATLNQTASKLVGIFGRDVFIYREPFSNEGYDLTVFRPFPKRAIRDEPLNVWLIDKEQKLLVVHPLAISWVSIRKRTLTHCLPVQDTRAITSVAISPSKELLVAINARGEAELFSVLHKQLLQILREDAGPYRPLVSAIFYGHSSLALAFADRPNLELIPDLNLCGDQKARELQLRRHNQRHYPRGSFLKLYHSTTVYGVGHILVAKPERKPGSDLTIIIPANEQFYPNEPEATKLPTVPEDDNRGHQVSVLNETSTVTPTVTKLPAAPEDDDGGSHVSVLDEMSAVTPPPTTLPTALEDDDGGRRVLVLDETSTATPPVKYWKIPGLSFGFAKW